MPRTEVCSERQANPLPHVSDDQRNLTASDSQAPLIIMWTSTRSDRNNKLSIPNHFVPAVPKTPQTGIGSDKHIFSLPPPDDCLSEWVIVIYDKNPYPGRVLEVHEGELFVDCLHAVGKPFSNTLFWPCLCRDLCWYEYDKLVTVIPKAVLKTGSAKHFAVDAQIWEAAMKKSLSQTDFSQVLQSL